VGKRGKKGGPARQKLEKIRTKNRSVDQFMTRKASTLPGSSRNTTKGKRKSDEKKGPLSRVKEEARLANVK